MRMRMRQWQLMGLGLWLATGCDGSASEPDASLAGTGGAANGGAAAGGNAVVAGAAGRAGGAAGRAGGAAGSAGGTQTLKAQIVAPNVAPGEENHVCVVVALDNQQPVWVDHARAVLTGGSHHLIVDRQPASTPLQLEPETCSPTMASDTTRLIIAQQRETEVQLPDQVAFKLVARQPLFLQLHYINQDDTAHDVSGSVELSVVRETQQPREAKSLFTGSYNINLAPRSHQTVESFYQPSSAAMRVFSLTSHTHHLGVHATIERAKSQTATDATLLHESTDWSEPPLTSFATPLALTTGEGLRLRCEYENTTDKPVTFGTLAEQEMCFMWVYYFDASN
jgi:hypothetical protein